MNHTIVLYIAVACSLIIGGTLVPVLSNAYDKNIKQGEEIAVLQNEVKTIKEDDKSQKTAVLEILNNLQVLVAEHSKQLAEHEAVLEYVKEMRTDLKAIAKQTYEFNAYLKTFEVQE